LYKDRQTDRPTATTGKKQQMRRGHRNQDKQDEKNLAE